MKSFDFIKFMAIFLVLWGHAVAELRTAEYASNPLFRFIYSFHMPLFMMIVGFFSANIYRRSFREMVTRKFRQLILPFIFFAFVMAIVSRVFLGYGRFINHFVNGLWFLKSSFVCVLLYWVATSLFKNKRRGMVLTLIISILLEPALSFLPYTFYQYIPNFELARMYPCFLVGAILHGNYEQFKATTGYLACCCFVVFCLLYIGWDSSFFTSQVLAADWHYWYRLAIGLAGSLFIISVVEILFSRLDHIPKFLDLCCLWGQETLGIYCLQTLILEILLARYVKFEDSNIVIFNFVITPLISLVVMGVCIYMVKLIKANRYLGCLFLGKELPKVYDLKKESIG